MSMVRGNEIIDGLEALWMSDPVTFAARLSLVLPVEEWSPYPYLAKMMRHVKRRVMEGDARIIISMPPRHGKSESLSFWLLLWYMWMFPERKVLLTSYAAGLPTDFIRRIRDLFLEFPDTFGIELVKANENMIITREGGRLWGAGVGTGITGKGFDLGIVDDPVRDWQQAMSTAQLQKIIDWYPSTFRTRKAPGASMIVIMTRWASRDLAGYLQHEDADDWEVIRLPAICEDEDDWMGREIGEALCSERWPIEVMEQEREVQAPRMWAGLYQQRPKAQKGNIIKSDTIGRWLDLPVPDRIIQTWDFAFGGQSDAASWSVGQLWIESAGDYYLVDQVRGRWELPECLEQVRAFNEAYAGTSVTLVEYAALGVAVARHLEAELINMKKITPKELGDKITRLRGASVAFERGAVYVSGHEDDKEWTDAWINELTSFPQGAADDQCDATSQIINYCEQRASRGVWAVYKNRRQAA